MELFEKSKFSIKGILQWKWHKVIYFLLKSDDFIKFNNLTDQIIDDEDDIVNNHLNIIREDAQMLTDEGELMKSIRGGNIENVKLDTYICKLEEIVNKKLGIYTILKNKIDLYKYMFI